MTLQRKNAEPDLGVPIGEFKHLHDAVIAIHNVIHHPPPMVTIGMFYISSHAQLEATDTYLQTDLHNFFCCLGTYFGTLLLPAKRAYLARKIALKSCILEPISGTNELIAL